MKEINEKFEQLPKEYFAQKFTNPEFPPMSSGVGWTMFATNMIFYIINILQIVNAEVALIRYVSIGLMAVAFFMFIAKIYWHKKNIEKHKVAFIHYSAWIFGELRLNLIFLAALGMAYLLSGGFLDEDAVPVIIGAYIGAAVLLVVDIVLNIVFWNVLKRKIVEGAYKQGGVGFFSGVKNRKKKSAIISTVAGIGMSACLAFITLSRFLELDWEDAWNPIIVVIITLVLLVLSLVFAYADALLLGRAHYVKKFEIEAKDEITNAD